jgi:hypothetical protein
LYLGPMDKGFDEFLKQNNYSGDCLDLYKDMDCLERKQNKKDWCSNCKKWHKLVNKWEARKTA